MLEHHTDAELPGRTGVRHGNGLAAPAKPARRGLQRTVDDLHQGGFAGAVLSQERMDFTGPEPEGHSVVGREVAKALDDVLGFEKVFAAAVNYLHERFPWKPPIGALPYRVPNGTTTHYI